jgi:tRNA (mo5U34)-methyltransferase
VLERFKNYLKNMDLNAHIQWLKELEKNIDVRMASGRGPEWKAALDSIALMQPTAIRMSNSTPSILGESQINLTENLMKLHPWRKGPFHYMGESIDTEWDCSQKWDRLAQHLGDQTGKYLLDIGCGSGYYLFRALAHNPMHALGIDPSLLFWCQFELFARHMQDPVFYLPVGLEDLNLPRFYDTVFCMGVLYHRKNPAATLRKLQSVMRPGGELYLETLTIAGEGHYCLTPWERYAKMKNVYFLPTDDALCHWVEQFGFKSPEIIDVSITSTQEQRATKWMHFESLQDFLQADGNLTLEGYPRPRRTLLKAIAK